MRRLGPRRAKADNAERAATSQRRLSRTRRVVAWVLVVLAALLVPLSVVTVWAVNTVTNTDHYVATLAPLVRERVITDYVAAQATDKLFDSVDVQQRLEKTLPKPAKFVAAPLTNQLHGFVQKQVTTLLDSTWFHNLWDSLNRKSHTAIVNVLTGKTMPGRRANRVVVDLTPVLTKAIDALDAKGVTVFDGVRGKLSKANALTLNLASSGQISQARTFFEVASDLGWAAPLLAVIVIVAAVAVAVDRRKTLLRVAIATGLAILLLLAGLALGRSFFVDHAADRVDPSVTGAIFDTITRFLKNGLRNVLIVVAVVAVVLWLAGPARWSRWVRSQVVRSARWVGRRAAELGNERNRRQVSAKARLGAAWALEHRSGLRLTGVVVAGVVVVFSGNLSVDGVWSTAIALAAYLVVLEVVLAWARRAAASPTVREPGPTTNP